MLKDGREREIGQELGKKEKESLRNGIIIVMSVLLVVGLVYLKGYRERLESYKDMTGEVNVSYVEDLDLYIPYPFNYTPISEEVTEIPPSVIGRELETMVMGDEEVVLEGFLLGEGEGYMIMTLRSQRDMDYDKEQMLEENKIQGEIESVVIEVNNDRMLEGIGVDSEGNQHRVERYVRPIGINEVVVDVVHYLEGRSFMDIQHILDGIRRG